MSAQQCGGPGAILLHPIPPCGPYGCHQPHIDEEAVSFFGFFGSRKARQACVPRSALVEQITRASSQEEG